MARNRKTSSINHRNILVFSFSHIGDTVLSTVVIRPLREKFKNAKITYLVGTSAYDVLVNDKMVDELILYDKKAIHSGLFGKLRLISDLRERKFDLVIDLRDSFWSRMIGAERWGFPLGIEKNIHAVNKYMRILKEQGISTKDAKPTLSLSESEVHQAKSFLIEKGIFKRRLIAIHPGGDWKYKLWPVEKFAKLADILCQEFDVQILVFTGPDELRIQNKIIEMMNNKAVVVDKMNLRTVAALIKQCDVYIGNDTGPTHIAAAVDTKAVAIFGPTDEHRCSPYGDKHIVVRSDLNLNCIPCHPGRKPGRCGKFPCEAIDAISVEQVVDKVDSCMSYLNRSFR